jgi:hypothetical protein
MPYLAPAISAALVASIAYYAIAKSRGVSVVATKPL